jgi:hypothetical protein
VPAHISVLARLLRALKDRIKMPDDRRRDMRQPLAYAPRPKSPASSTVATALVDPSPYSQQDLAPRMMRAVVEDPHVGRNPVPNLRHEIAKWLIVAAPLALAASVTMAPFMLL